MNPRLVSGARLMHMCVWCTPLTHLITITKEQNKMDNMKMIPNFIKNVVPFNVLYIVISAYVIFN
jgi:hypothetical protein